MSRDPADICGTEKYLAGLIKKVETQGNPAFEAEEMDSEDKLFVLYISGIYHISAAGMYYTFWASL